MHVTEWTNVVYMVWSEKSQTQRNSYCTILFVWISESRPGEGNGKAWWAAVHGVAKSWTGLSDFTFTFHFHALEKEMATHSSVLAWRIPGTEEPGGLPSMGSHRVGHDWSDLAAAAAAAENRPNWNKAFRDSHIGSKTHQKVCGLWEPVFRGGSWRCLWFSLSFTSVLLFTPWLDAHLYYSHFGSVLLTRTWSIYLHMSQST